MSRALAEYGIVTDSANNFFRGEAAIEMSVIHGVKRDFSGELASLDSHPYLFDASLQAPDDLAVSYNNRCYAYMKLGRFHKALADCTTSLKYGRIPDAVAKGLRLMKRVGLEVAPTPPAGAGAAAVRERNAT